MYYCEYCRYGINIASASLNGNAYMFYAFEKKQDRDRTNLEGFFSPLFLSKTCICMITPIRTIYYLYVCKFVLM